MWCHLYMRKEPPFIATSIMKSIHLHAEGCQPWIWNTLIWLKRKMNNDKNKLYFTVFCAVINIHNNVLMWYWFNDFLLIWNSQLNENWCKFTDFPQERTMPFNKKYNLGCYLFSLTTNLKGQKIVSTNFNKLVSGTFSMCISVLRDTG